MRPNNSLPCIALLGALLCGSVHAATLLDQINPQRTQDSTCGAKAPALLPSKTLDEVAVQRGRGAPMAQAAAGAMEQFSVLNAFAAGGDQALAGKRLWERHCAALKDAGFTHAGVAQVGKLWWLVLGHEGAPELLLTTSSQLEPPSPALSPSDALQLLNQRRAQAQTCGSQSFSGSSPLLWNEKLAAAATDHARDMANRGYFSHISPEGGTPGNRAQHRGYAYSRIGENIAQATYGGPEQAIAMWMKSPGHCANNMNPDFQEAGLAEARAGGMRFWVIVFGTQNQ